MPFKHVRIVLASLVLFSAECSSKCSVLKQQQQLWQKRNKLETAFRSSAHGSLEKVCPHNRQNNIAYFYFKMHNIEILAVTITLNYTWIYVYYMQNLKELWCIFSSSRLCQKFWILHELIIKDHPNFAKMVKIIQELRICWRRTEPTGSVPYMS